MKYEENIFGDDNAGQPKTKTGTESRPHRLPDASGRFVEVKTYGLRELIKPPKDVQIPSHLGVSSIEALIHDQAATHQQRYRSDRAGLITCLREGSNYIEGFILEAPGFGLLGLAITNPQNDRRGWQGISCEDFLIAPNARRLGVFPILFEEMAKRTLAAGRDHLQWETVKSNGAVIDRVTQGDIKAVRTTTVPLDGAEIISEATFSSLRERFSHLAGDQAGWDTYSAKYNYAKFGHYLTRQIDPNRDRHVMNWLAHKAGPNYPINANMLDQTGGQPFKALLTFHDSDLEYPVGYMSLWQRFSTFKTEVGLVGEHPLILNDEAVPNVMISMLTCLRDIHREEEEERRKNPDQVYRLSRDLLKLHFEQAANNRIWRFATEELGLEEYKMQLFDQFGCPVEEQPMVVFTLDNGQLKKVANMNTNRTIWVPNTIGAMNGKRPEILPEAQPGLFFRAPDC